VRALRFAAATCPTAVALDDTFPGDMPQLCDAVLRRLVRAHGPAPVASLLRLLLLRDAPLAPAEAAELFAPGPAAAADARAALAGLAPLLRDEPDTGRVFGVPAALGGPGPCVLVESVRARVRSLAWLWTLSHIGRETAMAPAATAGPPPPWPGHLLSVIAGGGSCFPAELSGGSGSGASSGGRLRPRAPRAARITALTSVSAVLVWEPAGGGGADPAAAVSAAAGTFFQVQGRTHGRPYHDLSGRAERQRCPLGDAVVTAGAGGACRVRATESASRVASAWRVVTFRAPERLASPALEAVDVTSASVLWTWSLPDLARGPAGGEEPLVEGFLLQVGKMGQPGRKTKGWQRTHCFADTCARSFRRAEKCDWHVFSI
jgi:hypothetical protein